jgi:hypothetical protein
MTDPQLIAAIILGLIAVAIASYEAGVDAERARHDDPDEAAQIAAARDRHPSRRA